MKKRMGLFIVICMLLVMPVSGCGDKPENDAPVEGTVTMPLSGAELPAMKPFSFTFASTRAGGADAFTDLVEEMNGLTGCTAGVKYFGIDDYDTQVNLALAAGEGKAPFEVFDVSTRLYNEYAAKGWLLPIGDYLEKYDDIYDFSDIPESMWEGLTIDGEIYGIPTSVNLQHLFYREDLFEKYGCEVPKTIDDLIAVCEKLKGAEEIKYPLAYAMGKGNGSMTEFLNVMTAQQSPLFDENNNPIFNNEDGVKAVETLKKLYSYMPPAATTYSNDDTMVLMQTGEIAITSTWATRAPFMDDPTVSKVVGKVKYAPAVGIEGKSLCTDISPEILVIADNMSQDPESVFLGIAEMSSYQGQVKAMELMQPSRAKAVTDNPDIVAANPSYQAVKESLESGATYSEFPPYFVSVSDIIGTYTAQAIDGSMGVQEALDQAVEECRVVLRDSGYL